MNSSLSTIKVIVPYLVLQKGVRIHDLMHQQIGIMFRQVETCGQSLIKNNNTIFPSQTKYYCSLAPTNPFTYSTHTPLASDTHHSHTPLCLGPPTSAREGGSHRLRPEEASGIVQVW